MSKRIPVGVFFALFTLSGFAGLIYESIWSHYLKLYLGHAAYAQTLVLAIFMGGMALGSWLVSRFTHRIRNLLLGYALAELGIGVLAIVFHGVFVALTDWSFDTVIPALGSPGAVGVFKVVLASALILPASILLGSTFPLMSAGIIRIHPGSQARTLAWLYFTNSLGAAVGVLASGFLLIEKLGLPGTILTAGLLNVALALVVWALAKGIDTGPGVSTTRTADAVAGRLAIGIQVLAFVTGGASFIYEIAWIRMLSMGLGASTHAFEVMLAAFILGMAMGGLVLALKPPREGHEVAWLSTILVAKGLLAVMALGAYGVTLDFIQMMMGALKSTPQGYVLLNVTGLVSSMAVMFPAALCAGMTLPLATSILIRQTGGEAAIGRVYAANTAGCIAGAVFATHIGMEWLGVKSLTGFGAASDIALGVALVLGATARDARTMAAVAAAIAVSLAAFATFDLDRLKMASGMFRHGLFLDPKDSTLDFYKDGKTATIAVTSEGGFRTIRTNGKPDAGIRFAANLKPTWDESTMILIAALPLAYKPDTKTVANIGFGSGLTTDSLLAAEGITRVDTIEIEPAMVEGAKLFGAFNSRAYADPRSHIHIEDAKTFFASSDMRYDVIVSEPSNPWVSGVATLFSDEFYARTRRHLKEGGLLVQWLQVYEIDFDLVASILKALGRHFPDYQIHTSQPGDIVVVAARDGKVPPLDGRLFQSKGMREALARVGYTSLPELRIDHLASRRVIEPLVLQSRYPVNSDYFPVVDQHAARDRFLKSSARDVATIPKSFVPFAAIIDGETRMRVDELDHTKDIGSVRLGEALLAVEAIELFFGEPDRKSIRVQASGRLQMAVVKQGLSRCDVDPLVWLDAVEDLLRTVTPVVRGPEVDRMLARLGTAACQSKLDPVDRERLTLYAAFHARDAHAMRVASDALLSSGRSWSPADRSTFVLAGLSARIVEGDMSGARNLWEVHKAAIPARVSGQFAFRLVTAHLNPNAVANEPPSDTPARSNGEPKEGSGDRPSTR
jgi:spermidine synthase